MFRAATVTQSSPQVRVETAHDAVEPDLSRYRLVEVIGRGGMGIVYRAEDLVTGQLCAVKIMRPELSADVVNFARFQFEIEVLDRFAHPNMVSVIDTGRIGGTSHYFAMEYVEGRDLDEVVRSEGPLDSDYVIDVIRDVCSALAEVHAQSFVHNDIKPANIIVPELDGDASDAMLIDFGLAQSVEGDVGGPAPLNDGSFNGSPLYAPPESYSGTIDHRSDIYSLGATAYHLLTGRPVFDERRPLAAIMAHVVREPVPVQCLRRNIDPALGAIVMRCLQKDPEERFQSVEELDAALEEVQAYRNS